MPTIQPFAVWLDDFFAAYYRHRPVNATFIGVHDDDHRLPDYSTAGVADVQREMATLLQRLGDGSVASPANEAERIDQTLAAGFLRIQQWEYASGHFQGGNPCVYTGEAIFGTLSLFLRPFAFLAQRAEAAIARMDAIPALLTQGRNAVTAAPSVWTERALRECRGAMHFLSDGVDRLMHTEGISGARFRAAADTAQQAFSDFSTYLESELRVRPTDGYACGEEAFARYLREGHCLTMDAAAVERYARDVFAEARGALEAGARQFGTDDWRAALAQLADSHPTTDAYYGQYRRVWDASRATAEAHDLLTWPDCPLRYVPQPEWARSCAGDLYFLPYRSPAPYDRLPTHDYLVTPIEPEMPRAMQEQRLRATNDSVIKLNHVVHHGGIGHHVQNWHAFRAPSRIGQMAAVDCASRIALFCGGTMAEGWSSYVVDLMDEIGFLTPLESFSQRYARLRAAARAIVDVNLHHGRFTLDQAIAFYRDEANFAPEAARAEAVKNSLFPGAAMMYLIGQDAICDLRADTAKREGAAFSLRRFHDRFLSYGSIPVPLIAAALGRETGD